MAVTEVEDGNLRLHPERFTTTASRAKRIGHLVIAAVLGVLALAGTLTLPALWGWYQADTASGWGSARLWAFLAAAALVGFLCVVTVETIWVAIRRSYVWVERSSGRTVVVHPTITFSDTRAYDDWLAIITGPDPWRVPEQEEDFGDQPLAILQTLRYRDGGRVLTYLSAADGRSIGVEPPPSPGLPAA